MFMRISEAVARAGFLCLALASCDDGGTASDGARTNARSGDGSGLADCKSATDSGWKRNCRVERDGDILTLRHADGGFHRFRVVRDGRGLVAADGAEPAMVAIVDKGQIELSIGAQRYRLPATVAAAVKP
jgi:hypothetical protein